MRHREEKWEIDKMARPCTSLMAEPPPYSTHTLNGKTEKDPLLWGQGKYLVL